MCYYVYADHAQYTIKTYAKMALFRLVLTGVLSTVNLDRAITPNRIREAISLILYIAQRANRTKLLAHKFSMTC